MHVVNPKFILGTTCFPEYCQCGHPSLLPRHYSTMYKIKCRLSAGWKSFFLANDTGKSWGQYEKAVSGGTSLLLLTSALGWGGQPVVFFSLPLCKYAGILASFCFCFFSFESQWAAFRDYSWLCAQKLLLSSSEDARMELRSAVHKADFLPVVLSITPAPGCRHS